MNPDDIKSLIDQLLKTGEILATKGFELAYRQVYVLATQELVTAAIFGAISIWLIRWFFSGMEAMREDRYDSNWEFPLILGGILGLISCPFFVLSINSAIGYLVNPQWYAMELLLEHFIK